MKLLAGILIVCGIATGVYAQKNGKESAPTPTPERDRRVVALLNDARLAAPELAADVFLRIVESKKVTEPNWRREILDEAMRLADEVKYPVRKARAFRGTGIVDTVSGYMTYAYDQKLDTLSLKARIIKNWISEDKAKARQIVFQIGGDLGLKPVRCDEAMSYVVDDIYEAVGAVGKVAFSAKEIADGARGLFVLPWIENIQSPTQILPAIRLISNLNPPPIERQLLTNSLERAINKNFGDDRSFGFALTNRPSSFNSFIQQSPDSSTFLATWRDFLKKNATGKRCLDNEWKTDEVPWPVIYFNIWFSEDKQFKVEDFADVEYKGIPNDKPYLDSEMYKKVSLLFRSARETKNLPENREDKAAQLEWQLKVGDVLELLDSWKASEKEAEIEVFNSKTVFYRTLIGQVSEPEIQTRVLRAFMRYLASSPVQKDSFIEWSIHSRWAADKYPNLFRELADEFPSPNFRVMIAAL